MAALLQTIKKLIKELPGKDAKLAEKFLNKRDFESIYEIVKSDINSIEKAVSKESIYAVNNTNLAELIELKQNLELYMNLLKVPDNSDDLNNTFYE